MATLKVYGWTGFREQCPTPHRQTREVMLAASKAEVTRVTGMSTYAAREIGETRNDSEVTAATTAGRGVVLWRPLYSSDGEWTRADAQH